MNANEFHFRSLDKGISVEYTINMPEKVAGKLQARTVPDARKIESEEERLKAERDRPNVDLLIRRIISDSYKFTKKIHESHIHISVTDVDINTGQVKYEIIEQPNHPSHEVALKALNKKQANKEFKEIAKHQIHPLDKTIQEADDKTLLERFSGTARQVKSNYEKIIQTISGFMQKIATIFRKLESLWYAITNQTDKKVPERPINQLHWDLNLLCEICGNPPVEGISLLQSLKYMSSMLDREREDVADPELQDRFRKAVKLGGELENIKKNYSESKAKDILKEIRKTISNLDDGKKFLIPVGFSDNGQFNEMLLEVTKGSQGNCNVALISTSDDVRNLFDQQEGIDTTSQSIRREIVNVDQNELLGVIPTFIDLQTAPECRKSTATSPWKSIFLQSLKFHKSKVEVGKVTETYQKDKAPGKFEEALAYLKAERKTPEEGKRFELAARLHFFLDICKNNQAGLKNKEFWTLVKSTANQMAVMIEKEKGLLGTSTAQGKELVNIYSELKGILDDLEIHLPELTDLSKTALPLVTGDIRVETHPLTPPLLTLTNDPTPYQTVNPSLVPLNKNDITDTFRNWGMRAQAFVDSNRSDIAANEMKVMIRSLSPMEFKTFINTLSMDNGMIFINGLKQIKNAFTTAAKDKEESLQDIASLAFINILINEAARKINQHPTDLSSSYADLNDVIETRLSLFERSWIQEVRNQFFDAQALSAISNRTVPLYVRAPKFAEAISKEVTNRYLTETCPLGCIGDNCPNYAKMGLQNHTYHPLYMLHNFVDTFCEKMLKKGNLKRDEIVDLMYTQETNQKANAIWTSAAFEFEEAAHRFDENDYKVQTLNAFTIYLDHPHFFKYPELRWHFETKIMTHGNLEKLLSDKTYEPFFHSIVKKLKKEITAAYVSGDKEVGSYLMHIFEEIKESANKSNVSNELNQLFEGINTREVLEKWTKELLGKKDEFYITSQRMLFSLFINDQYKKLIEEKNFNFSDEQIEMLISVIARLESIEKGNEEVDPEIKDRYKSIMALTIPSIQNRIRTEASKGEYINRILQNLNEPIAAQRLQWEGTDFPVFTAMDNNDNDYQFNITTGKLSFKERRLEELPKFLKKNEDLQRLFGSAMDEYWKVSGTPPGLEETYVTAYLNDKYPNIRILMKGSPNKSLASSAILVERSIDSGKKRREWVTYSRFNVQDQLANSTDLITSSDIPVAVGIAIGERSCWVDRQKEKVYVFELDSDKPWAIISLKTEMQKVGSTQVQVTRVADVEFLSDHSHLLNATTKELDNFTSFEDPDFIQVIGKDKKTNKLDFARFQLASSGAALSYQIGEAGATTRSLPGYVLSPFGTRPGVKDPAYGVKALPTTFDGYQLFKKDGDERLLIPVREFEMEYNVEGDSIPIPNILRPKKFSKTLVNEYQVDMETNRLNAKTGDAYAYLSYLALTHSDYESASFYLEKAKTISGYGSNYQQIFSWMDKWEDDSPNGTALKLRFELFREGALNNIRLKNIQAGEDYKSVAIHSNKVNRLETIMDLYAVYTKAVNKQPGAEALDPALRLRPEDEKAFETVIKAFMTEHGNDHIRTFEPRPVRAIEIPLQKFMDKNKNKINVFGIRNAAMLIWSYKGNDKDRSPFIPKDPRWVLENFRDVFNQILKGDENSQLYKQVTHQVRMLSELSKTVQLDPLEKEAIEYAQFFLLKLMTIKEDKDNPGFFDDVEEYLEKKGILGPEEGMLPSFAGPLFKPTRVEALNDLGAVISNLKDTDFAIIERNLRPGERFNEGSRILMEAIGKIPFSLRSKIHDYADETWNNLPNKTNFKEDFKAFLLDTLIDKKGAKSLLLLNSVFSMIEGLPASQPKQKMTPPRQIVPAPRQTYLQKYGYLLNQYNQERDVRSIERLESIISNKPVPPRPALIITDPSKINPVVSQNVLARFNSFFVVKPLPIAAQQISTQVFDDLEQSNEKAYVRNAKKNREDFNAFDAGRKDVSIIKEDAIKVKAGLNEDRDRIGKEEEVLKHNLLQNVDLFNTQAGLSAMRRLVGKDIKPSLDALILLWRRNAIDQDWNNDHPFKMLGITEMPRAVLNKLDEDITKYLGLYTEHQHLNRVVDLADTYINSCGDKGNSKGSSQIATELYDTIQTKRYYSLNKADNADYKNLLYIEYIQDIILRQGQVDIKREMVSQPNAVRQLRPGYGKTAVLLPLEAEEKADGTNLVGMLIPEELYETNCRDLDVVNRQLFGKEMFKLEFGLKSDKSVEALQILYKNLLETMNGKGFFISTKRSVLGVINAYKMMLNQLGEMAPGALADKKKELIDQIRVMTKIVSLLYNKTSIIADEVDACLDIRKEVNFAMGDKVPVGKIEGDVGFELISIILNAKKGDQLFSLREAFLANTQAESFSPVQLKEKMKNLAKEVAGYHFNEIQGSGYQKTKEDLINYLMNDPNAVETEAWVYSIEKSTPDLFKKITSMKAFFDVGFGKTLGKTGQVNYIRDPVSKIWTIPAKSSDIPNVGSEFDDDVERMSFTYQDYVQRGVSYEQVYQIIAGMRNRAIMELKSKDEDSFSNILDTQGARDFDAFIKRIDPDNKLGKNITLATMDSPNSVASVVAALNESPMGRAVFCHKYVVGEMRRFNSQITSNSTDVAEVNEFNGFTGTPWNKNAYNDKIDAQLNKGTDGMTWELMLGRNVPVLEFEFDAKKPIESIVSNLDVLGNYQAVVDTGAYLRGTSNKEFADKALQLAKEEGKKVYASIYFDASGKIVKKVGDDGKPLPIAFAESTDLMNNITLYDQAHTVGADIKQGKKAQAIVTIGPNTFIRDLFQAVWRLRQLHQDQRVALAVSREVKELILNGEQRELTKEDVYKFCLTNETIREADDNYRAEKDKIQSTVKRAILPEFLRVVAGNASDETIYKVATKLATGDAGFFVKKKNPEDAYAQYGKLKTSEKPGDIFDDLQIKEARKCEGIVNVFEELDLQDSANRFKEIKNAIEIRPDKPTDWFPNEVQIAVAGGAEVEQEAEAEMELEAEMMIETETQSQTETQAEVNIPIVQTGQAGSGDVNALGSIDIENVMMGNGFYSETTRRLADGVAFFDNDIYTSAVFERNLPKYKAVGPPQMTFYSNRKFVKNVLIAQFKPPYLDTRWAMFIPTIHEAHGGCKEYIQSNMKLSNSQAVEVAISAGRPVIVYKTGNDRTDTLPFNDKADLDKFYRFYVQAKLFNGEIEFASKEEQDALKVWVSEKGVKEFREFFEKNILAAKPRRFADAYQTSSLRSILDELEMPVLV